MLAASRSRRSGSSGPNTAASTSASPGKVAWASADSQVASAGRDSLGDHLLGSTAERLNRAAKGLVLTIPASRLR